MSQKEQYQKPELGVIELKAEEVLAVGCKTATLPAAAQASCLMVPCTVLGS